MTERDVALRVQDLSVSYITPTGQEVTALHDVSFRVRKSAIHGVVGETGSGKSTIARAVLRLGGRNVWINNGRIDFAGHGDIVAMPRRAYAPLRGANIGYIGQSPFDALHPILPIERQFHQLLRTHGQRVSQAKSRAVAEAALTSVGIRSAKSVLQARSYQLSGGMAQRVVIAMACLLEPELIIADEPTTSLDLTTQRQILDLIERKVQEYGISVVLITHDLGVVAQYCNAVTVLYAGRVMEDGPARAVLARPGHPYTQALLAASRESGMPAEAVLGSAIARPAPEPGCPFRNRCRQVIAECKDPIAVVDLAEGWTAACVRVGEKAAECLSSN